MNVPLSPFSGRQESPGFRRGEVQIWKSRTWLSGAIFLILR
ncbi:Cell division protein FtsH [Nodularia spumigena CCY9414]|nr:Cell division protein FtsH [Nodularia spumigena CCY9414]